MRVSFGGGFGRNWTDDGDTQYVLGVGGSYSAGNQWPCYPNDPNASKPGYVRTLYLNLYLWSHMAHVVVWLRSPLRGSNAIPTAQPILGVAWRVGRAA